MFLGKTLSEINGAQKFLNALYKSDNIKLILLLNNERRVKNLKTKLINSGWHKLKVCYLSHIL